MMLPTLKRISIYLFCFAIILNASELRVKYFLTEYDFLSNNSCLERATIGRNHFLVELDENDRIVSKVWFDGDKNIIEKIVYRYHDLSKSLTEQEVFNGSKKFKISTF